MSAVATRMLFDPNKPVYGDPTAILFGLVQQAAKNLHNFVENSNLFGVPSVKPRRGVNAFTPFRRAPQPESLSKGFTKAADWRVPNFNRIGNNLTRAMAHLSAAGASQAQQQPAPLVSSIGMIGRQAAKQWQKQFDRLNANFKGLSKTFNSWVHRMDENVADMSDGKADLTRLKIVEPLHFPSYRAA